MILSNLRMVSKTRLRVVLSVLVITTILLATIPSVSASPPSVQIETTTDIDEPVPGESVDIDATISNLVDNNGDSQNVGIRYVYLRKGGELDTYRQSEDVGVIAPGGSLTIPFSVTFDNPGKKQLDLVIVASNSGRNSPHRYQVPIYIDVNAATNDVSLDVSNQIRNDSSVIRTELYQFGSVEVEDIQIRAVADGNTVARVPMPDVPGEGSQTVMLDDTDIPAGNITVVATFTAGRDQQTAQQSLQYTKYSPAPTSAIALTNVVITQDGGTLTIESEAANVGTTQVNSVLVSAANTDAVTPVGPTKEYFIDNIDSNEFETFEMTVDAASDLDQIPIQVEYTINGQRVSSTIPVDIGTIGSQSDSNQQGGSPLLAVVFLLIVVAGVGFVMYRWGN